MPYEPPPELAAMNLADLAEAVAQRRLPPIDRWTPGHVGDSEMQIAADGTWYHQGGAITRPAMIRAFASLLLRDAAGQHWLVTPQQKLRVMVEDAALMAVDMGVTGDTLAFRLNTDDIVIAGPDHPLTARGDADTPALYLAVRHGVEARLNRSTYAQLAEHALSRGADWHVASRGATFSLIPR